MTIQQIKLGAYANDGTGDDLRTAFQKVNSNFTELYTANISNAINVGTGTGIFAQKNNSTLNLEFKSLTSTNNTVQFTSNPTTIDFAVTTDLVADTSPQLGGNLDLNGHVITGIYGGGIVNTPIDGFSVPILAGLIELLLQSNQFIIDMGSFDDPATSDLIMGMFVNPPENNVDFGTF